MNFLHTPSKTHATRSTPGSTADDRTDFRDETFHTVRNRLADTAAACAVRALLYEVSTTPKPGLVDRNNSGSHKDMDFFTFLDSSAALIPWFRNFFCLGWDHADDPDETLFLRLRAAGQDAEADMFAATKGVNTHKGLIFASAILCGALGKLYGGKERVRGEGKAAAAPTASGKFPEQPIGSDALLCECRSLGACSLGDFKTEGSAPDSSPTSGEACHFSYGLSGARGEAAAGFPSAVKLGLPALKRRRSEGYSLNDASALTLLTILTEVDDTNMIHRGGREKALQSKDEAKKLLASVTKENFRDLLIALDESYIRDNLSPGGCADLLAVSLLLYFLEECGMVSEFN
jgi:holo-ACP synthase/triphosphoribosyl-dephospho-CoA synthase